MSNPDNIDMTSIKTNVHTEITIDTMHAVTAAPFSTWMSATITEPVIYNQTTKEDEIFKDAMDLQNMQTMESLSSFVSDLNVLGPKDAPIHVDKQLETKLEHQNKKVSRRRDDFNPESIYKADLGKLLHAKKDSGITLIDEPEKIGIPSFCFPFGRPNTKTNVPKDWKSKSEAIFDGKPLGELDFVQVTLACGITRYLNLPLFQHSAQGQNSVTWESFYTFFSKVVETYHTDDSIAFAILKQSENNYLLAEDIEAAVKDVTYNHPGLEFLAATTVFQKRYMETVVTRLFYSKKRNTDKRMSFKEFVESGFLNNLKDVETLDDVNRALDLFSYQHFYVIYCKFWELDSDHDMLIDANSLSRYDNYSLTPAIIDRIVNGHGKPLETPGVLSYQDFIWFILSVEDKKSTHAIEYWFRCLDIDGDGVISLYELAIFFEDQYDRMFKSRVSDLWKWEDFVCSLYNLLIRIDLIQPANKHLFTLQDLKRSGSAHIFFNMTFDLRKHDLYIRRCDPAFRELDDITLEDKDGVSVKLEGFQRFAAKAYQRLAEEEASEEQSTGYDLSDLGQDIDDGMQSNWELDGWEKDVELEVQEIHF